MAGGAAGLAVAGAPVNRAFAADPLKLWTIGIAKVGAKDWSAMEAQAGIQIAYSAKSALTCVGALWNSYAAHPGYGAPRRGP